MSSRLGLERLITVHIPIGSGILLSREEELYSTWAVTVLLPLGILSVKM